MNKPYNNRTKIGVAKITYDETGKPTQATFEPAAVPIDRARLSEALASFPAENPKQAVLNAEAVLSAWFINVGEFETADREHSRIESEAVTCDTWSNGAPQYCEVAFYFATTK